MTNDLSTDDDDSSEVAVVGGEAADKSSSESEVVVKNGGGESNKAPAFRKDGEPDYKPKKVKGEQKSTLIGAGLRFSI